MKHKHNFNESFKNYTPLRSMKNVHIKAAKLTLKTCVQTVHSYSSPFLSLNQITSCSSSTVTKESYLSRPLLPSLTTYQLHNPHSQCNMLKCVPPIPPEQPTMRSSNFDGMSAGSS